MCDDPDYPRTYIKILCKIYLLYKLKFKIKRVEIKKKKTLLVTTFDADSFYAHAKRL